MIALEDRVERLEEMLGRFLEQSSRIHAAIHEFIAEIRASNARTNRQLLAFQEQTDKDREEFRQRMMEAEQKADKDREEFRQRMMESEQKYEKERKDFNRRLAEITDSQGLLIENMVWPNLERIARQVFGGDVLITQAIRLKRKHPLQSGRMKEIDLLAASPDAVLVCEAKSKPTSEKTREFLDSLKEFKEFFPEYGRMRIVPMVASIAFDPGLVSFMTSQGVLALGFGDETMELLNPEAARQRD